MTSVKIQSETYKLIQSNLLDINTKGIKKQVLNIISLADVLVSYVSPNSVTSKSSLARPYKQGKLGRGILSTKKGDALNHDGVDISMNVNTEIYSIYNGTVEDITSADATGYGLRIIIQHTSFPDSSSVVYSTYSHLNAVTVNKGQKVKSGQLIALSGNTGRSTGAHLHFELLKDVPYVIKPDRSNVIDCVSILKDIM